MEQTIEYKGYSIEIINDTDASNPYDGNDEGCLPLISSYGRNEITDYSKGEIQKYIAFNPTDGQIIRHQKAIADIVVDVEDADASCWGFYGDDFEGNGLLEMAKNDIDCHIDHTRKERNTKLKELIKNNVPIINRAQILH